MILKQATTILDEATFIKSHMDLVLHYKSLGNWRVAKPYAMRLREFYKKKGEPIPEVLKLTFQEGV